MKKLILILLLMAVLPVSAWAANLAPADFAYGLALEVDQDAPLYEVDLPQSIYEAVTQRNLGDIRVFNQQGEVVPHTLWIGRPETVPAAPPGPCPVFSFVRAGGGISPVPVHARHHRPKRYYRGCRYGSKSEPHRGIRLYPGRLSTS